MFICTKLVYISCMYSVFHAHAHMHALGACCSQPKRHVHPSKEAGKKDEVLCCVPAFISVLRR